MPCIVCSFAYIICSFVYLFYTKNSSIFTLLQEIIEQETKCCYWYKKSTWARVKSKELEASLSLLCTQTQDRPRPSHAADPATTSAATKKKNCHQRRFYLNLSYVTYFILSKWINKQCFKQHRKWQHSFSFPNLQFILIKSS